MSHLGDPESTHALVLKSRRFYVAEVQYSGTSCVALMSLRLTSHSHTSQHLSLSRTNQFDEIMVAQNQTKWGVFESLLEGARSRGMHAVFSVRYSEEDGMRQHWSY